MKRSLNKPKEMSSKRAIGESDDGSDEPLLKTQKLCRMSSQEILFDSNSEIFDDNNNSNSSHLSNMEMKTSEEDLHEMNGKNLAKVRHNSQLVSQQELFKETVVWKGSEVVNYKKFKKFGSQSDSVSQLSNTSNQSIVGLKQYDNPYYKDLSQDHIQSEVENIDIDYVEKSSNSEMPVSKKARH